MEREGMWADKAEAESDEDSDEDEQDEEESGSDDEESDGLGGTINKQRPLPHPSSTSLPPASTASTSQQPSITNKFAVQVDKFGNAPQMTKREAKKAAKEQQASKGDGDDTSDDSLDDDLLQAGAKNKGVTKAMKASSLNDAAKKPASSQPMNRKER